MNRKAARLMVATIIPLLWAVGCAAVRRHQDQRAAPVPQTRTSDSRVIDPGFIESVSTHHTSSTRLEK